MAITTVWTESFVVLCCGLYCQQQSDRVIDSRDNGRHGKTKGLRTPPPRWVSAQLLYVCVTAW